MWSALPSLEKRGRVTNEERRVKAAALLRELGHDFVARTFDDEQLDELTSQLATALDVVKAGQPRVRTFSSDRASFAAMIPEGRSSEKHQLFLDSIVSGGANPMGLNATVWREGDVAVMEVTLGRAFEGAPGRAHGGTIAALLDETMGVVHVFNEALAYTAQLDITYSAPTPIGEPITARAWLARREGRKLYIDASLHAGDVKLASATALFIAVDPTTFVRAADDSA
jgi:acyl-coenzyme A thioesterase PaaI-like protein